jgi:hypothetical protein
LHAFKVVAKVSAAAAAYPTDFIVVIVVSVLSDQLAARCSLQACDVTTPAARKQLLKFVEDNDECIGPGSLSTIS